MSHCLSNATVFTPNPNPLRSRCPPLLGPQIGGRNWAKNGLRPIAADGGQSLDHLQRQQKQLNQQPRKRTAPAAPIGLWDRYPTARTLQQMLETMDRLMEDPLAYTSGGWSSPRPADAAGYSRGRTPWEIKEGETEYRMRFDMPGMTKQDVRVWVEEKMLVVKAEKAAAENEEESGEEWPAKSYGRYSCRIALPENVEFEKIKAEVKDGVLYVVVPKASVGGKVFDISVQ